MNADMQKALVSLIDETLGEIEELKKSDRFSASEVSLGDSKSGVKDCDKNGKLGKDEDKKDEDEDKDDEDEDKEMDKAEGKNSEADPNAGNHQPVAKGDMMAGDDNGDTKSSAPGKNRESDPMSKMEDRMCKMEDVMSKMEAYMSKGEDKEDEDKKDDKDEDKKDLKKSEESSDRIDSLEKSLASIAKMVEDIANTPVPAQSVSYKDVQPLKKSEDAVEPLQKSQLVDQLFELKKTGTEVNTLDVTRAELASPAELVQIANKYGIK